MEFTFEEDQLMFQQSVRDFLAAQCTAEQIRSLWDTDTGRSAERWQKLAEMGLLGILIPEAHGGLGMNEIDFVLPLEEAGRAGLPEPLADVAAVAAPMIRDSGDEKLAEQWLPRIASGESLVAIDHSINPIIADAHLADMILLKFGDELHAVGKDEVELVEQPASDTSRKLFTVAWNAGAEGTRFASGAQAKTLLDDALDRAALATAAQLVGVSQQLVDLAVEYSKDRHQFGKPIGSFQALKHHLASVQVKTEFARPAVYRAAFSVAHGTPSRSTDVSQAKSLAGEAAVMAAKTALQVHGAIGYTWEVDLHIWMKRAWALDGSWGSGLWHRRRIGDAILDANSPAPSFGFEGA